MDNNEKIEVSQTSPINFNVRITTVEGLAFISNLQCNPAQLNRESILNNFKTSPKNWIIDLVNTEVIKSEVDTTITPNNPPEIKN